MTDGSSEPLKSTKLCEDIRKKPPSFPWQCRPSSFTSSHFPLFPPIPPPSSLGYISMSVWYLLSWRACAKRHSVTKSKMLSRDEILSLFPSFIQVYSRVALPSKDGGLFSGILQVKLLLWESWPQKKKKKTRYYKVFYLNSRATSTPSNLLKSSVTFNHRDRVRSQPW